MATGVVLHPLAKAALVQLKTRMVSEEGREASERRIVSALIYGATPAQAAGMLNEFIRAAAAYDAERKQDRP